MREKRLNITKLSQKVMKTKLHDDKSIIVDELSMVSGLMLTHMHLKLQELFGGAERFGSGNMMFVGDLLQLQRVHDKSLKKHFYTN